MLSRHGRVLAHPPSVSAVSVAIRAVSLEVQLLGHPTHRLQGLGFLLFRQLLHREESESVNFKVSESYLSLIDTNDFSKIESFSEFIDDLGWRLSGELGKV